MYYNSINTTGIISEGDGKMKVLSIGNSFSSDAHRYLHKVAKADNYDMKCVNLYIGGCSLFRHFINMNNDTRAYLLEFNGEGTGFYVAIKETLQSDEWDYITLQQVSRLSVSYDTYCPYIQELTKYIRYHSPKTKILLHQTWAYEKDSEKLKDLGYASPDDMFADLKKAYEEAARDIKADGIIPAGQCMQNLSANGMETIHRDSYHAGLGAARYAIALTWYGYMTGNPVEDNAFREFDVPVSEYEAEIARNSAAEALKE
jgi:hypothetical protein